MTLEEATVESMQADAEKNKAHARLMNAQASKMEQETESRRLSDAKPV